MNIKIQYLLALVTCLIFKLNVHAMTKIKLSDGKIKVKEHTLNRLKKKFKTINNMYDQADMDNGDTDICIPHITVKNFEKLASYGSSKTSKAKINKIDALSELVTLLNNTNFLDCASLIKKFEERITELLLQNKKIQNDFIKNGKLDDLAQLNNTFLHDDIARNILLNNIVQPLILNKVYHKTLTDKNNHTNIINSIRFNHDSTKIITASYDNTAKIWSAHDGTFYCNLAGQNGHTSIVNSATFNHDSTRIITASHDKKIKIWSGDGIFLFDLVDPSGHISIVNSAAFNHDSTKIITASDKKAKIWSAYDGRFLFELSDPNNNTSIVNAATFNHDSTKIATTSNYTATIWSAHHDDHGALLFTLAGPNKHQEYISSIEFNHAGSTIVTASYDNTAKIWSAYDGTFNFNLAGPNRHKDALNSASFNHDDTKIVTASDRCEIKIWAAHDGIFLFNLNDGLYDYGNSINSAVFNHDSTKIVTASDHETAKIWYIRDAVIFAEYIKNNRLTIEQALILYIYKEEYIKNPVFKKLKKISNELEEKPQSENLQKRIQTLPKPLRNIFNK